MNKLVIIPVAVIFLLISSYIVFDILESSFTTKVTIDFELPIPDDIAYRYSIPKFPTVKKVILSGFFSDWDDNDNNYMLSPVVDDPKNQKWSIDTILPPGEHQYKFAIYVEESNQVIWCRDSDSYRQVFNGMESYNSLVEVKSYKEIKATVLKVIYLLIILLMPYLFYIISRHFQIKKFIYILSVLIVVLNILFTVTLGFYNNINNSFISRSILSIIQNDFEREYNNSYIGDSMYKTFNVFLWYKLEKIGIRNIESRFNEFDLIFFDKEFNYVTSDYRSYISSKFFKDIGVTILSPQIDNLKENKINIVNYLLPKFESIYSGSNLLTGVNSFIFPGIYNNKIIGYYGLIIRSNLSEILNIYMKFNIGSILFILVITAVFNYMKRDSKKDEELLLKEFTHRYGITKREEDIIPYIIEGFSNKEIADILNISKRTVDNHIYNTLHKAEAKNRVELVHIIKNEL